jgi:hypothetical protein
MQFDTSPRLSTALCRRFVTAVRGGQHFVVTPSSPSATR